ncbi:MAG: chromosomal replication initiator protein DnaA [Chloroflexi bacterium]|nr:chromosomal replication initiator protein DnaA [Chloroflexota bacterium]MCY3695717.1 chromosomal replication initiator protein DnaA [Chloroflexota bacterium]MXX79600.1 chromosomal replication initiator protein DnaA [Chloroflexota bacterium]MYF21181.1 chromosomal replication initiator protein DnaA [Chloroflexota bacterium]
MVTRSVRSFNDPHSDPRAIWQRALELLRNTLGRDTFDTWFSETHAVEIRGGVLHVGVPTVFKLETLRGSYYPHLASAVREAAGRSMEIELRVAPRPEPVAPALNLSSSHGADAERSQPIQPARSRPAVLAQATFDRFVEGASNQIAVTAARRVAFHPGEDTNPLFIYSSSGLGKTHLLHAIAHVTMQRYYTVLVDTESYVRQFVNSVGAGERAAFQEKYESAEVLIIDDVQKLGGKVQTQDEFYNVFNALHQRDRQIVIASDMPPRLLTGLGERLVTRFEGGLVVEINPPDLELRIAILQRTLDNWQMEIDDGTLLMVAERGGTNVRALLGALQRVRMYSEMERSPITPAIVMKALAGLPHEELRKAKPTVPELIAAAADITGVPPELFTSPRKDRRTARARQIVMYLACRHTDLSLHAIGEALGGRDHSTVLHGRDKVERLLAQTAEAETQWWLQQISEIRSRLHL